MSDVEWLLREATDEQTLPVGQHNVIDDERWRTIIERLSRGLYARPLIVDKGTTRTIRSWIENCEVLRERAARAKVKKRSKRIANRLAAWDCSNSAPSFSMLPSAG